MLRKLGKNILFISVPLFILLLIHYHNNGHMSERDRTRRRSTDKSVHTEAKPDLLPPKSQSHSTTDQWRLLADGTVIHRGNNDQHRPHSFVSDQSKSTVCSALRTGERSFVVVVESDIVNFEQRQLIRDTWALDILQRVVNFRVVFLVGLTHDSDTQNKLHYENLIYEDIVQIAIYEDFQNLTHKSIHMLHWYTKFCANADFLFKTDDDIYLHIPNIMNLFRTITLNGSILCHQNKSRKILRSLSDIHYYMYALKNIKKQEVIKQVQKKFHKYLIASDKLPGTLYPEYCSGFAYAMSYDVATKLLEASTSIPYLGIEDVFITGLCREKCNLTITDSVHFRLKPYIQPIEAKCAFENGRITSNEMTVEDLHKLWSHINTQGYYCKMTAGSLKQ